ncbi:MAG: ATPase, T2SS/T4P/T4SS family [Bryobacteraceae bacterium]
MDESTSYDRILCYLAPIEKLLRDDEISEVIVNADRSVFIERAGLLQRVDVAWEHDEYLGHALRSIARMLGQDITPDAPTLDTRLPDGSRVAIAIPPVSPEGPTVTIRKFQRRYFTLDTLVRIGSLSEQLAERLRTLVRDEKANILISGGTGAGKTSLLNALVAEIPPHERLGIIEDTREIQATAPNRFQFEARCDQPAVTIRDLVKASLRHRPDRLIIGEVRGPEAFDLINALNTGHSGSIATVHANSALLALSRLTTLILMEGAQWPVAAIKAAIAEAIRYVVHVTRNPDGRRVVNEVIQVQDYDIRS